MEQYGHWDPCKEMVVWADPLKGITTHPNTQAEAIS